MHKRISLLFSLLIFCIGIYVYSTSQLKIQQSVQTTITPSPAVLGQQTKTKDCQAENGMPDPSCTPGAIFSTATVAQICTKGYSASVRNVSTTTKKDVYAEYGIYSHTTGEYEVDHLISLELGGSNDVANLWPEAASPTPGFHEKDMVENYLHDMVCEGKISLATAQDEIAHNWLKVYQSVPNIGDYAY